MSDVNLMAETNHSPGPWQLEHTDRDRINVFVPSTFGINVLAIMECGFNEPFESQQQANARLIAAAPELLAAAKAVLDGLNARIDAAPMTDVPVFDGIAALHSAIAKAECRS